MPKSERLALWMVVLSAALWMAAIVWGLLVAR